jgi:hypothetical protein
MNRSYAFFAIAALVFAAGAFHLANSELASGAVYPPYSSLRADRDGSKLLFDALSRMPGIAVDRNFLPLTSSQEKSAAILLLGVVPQSFNAPEELAPLQDLAEAGNRIVIAFQYEPALSTLEMPAIEKLWGVRIGTAKESRRSHPFFFRESKGWDAIRVAGNKNLAIERSFGEGSILLIVESSVFANDLVLANREPDLISQAIGDQRRVIFDESHLGIGESGSIMGLARRFRLMGFAAGLAICALLFLWKNAPGFPPPAPARAANRSGITAQAGLVTLLRRHIPAAELAATCWRSWLETNRHAVTPERVQRAEQILLEPASGPADTLRRIGAVLQSKGKL